MAITAIDSNEIISEPRPKVVPGPTPSSLPGYPAGGCVHRLWQAVQCRTWRWCADRSCVLGPCPEKNPRCIHQQQKCDGRRSPEANQWTVRHRGWNTGITGVRASCSQTAAKQSVTDVAAWMDGGEEWHAVEKIQTGRSVQLCTESVGRPLLLQWWRTGGDGQ